MDLVRQHKPELLEMLRRQGWRVKHPERPLDQEAQDIARMVQERGYALTWCEAVKDLVAFHRDDVDPSTLPPGFVPYSDAELRELFGDGKPGMTPKGLQLIHAAKKEGARVVGKDAG